jgi:cytoskeletal protein RodZ
MVFEEIRIVNLSNRSFGPFKFPKYFLAKWIVKDSKTIQQTKLYRFNTEVFTTYSTLATTGTLLETAEPPKIEETKQTANAKNFKQKIFNILGKHWLIIFVICFFLGILTIPRLFFDFNVTPTTNNEKQYTESTPVETANPSPTLVRNRSDRQTRNSNESGNIIGRYDQSSKRPIRK